MTHTVESKFYDDGRTVARYIGDVGRTVGESIQVPFGDTFDCWLDTFKTEREAKEFIKEVFAA